MIIGGGYVHSLVNFFWASPPPQKKKKKKKNRFLQISQNIDGFRQNNSQGF